MLPQNSDRDEDDRARARRKEKGGEGGTDKLSQ